MKLAYKLYIPKKCREDLPPVILIHCLVENRWTWKTIAPAIAEKTGRKVYAIDCRNAGESPGSEEHGSEVITEDLGEFFLQHKIKKAIIVGHSLGGVVAMQFALKEPSKVEKIVVEDSPARKSEHKTSNFVPSVLKFVEEAYENQPAEDGEEAVKEYIRYFFRQIAPMLKLYPDFVDVYDWEKLPLRWTGQKLELQFNLHSIMNAVRSDKLLKQLDGTFDGDCLFLYGKESQFKVDQDLLISKHFPKAVKKGFDKAGHFIHHVYPEEFTREVINFINSNTTQASKL